MKSTLCRSIGEKPPRSDDFLKLNPNFFIFKVSYLEYFFQDPWNQKIKSRWKRQIRKDSIKFWKTKKLGQFEVALKIR